MSRAGVPETADLGIYLGVPSIYGQVKKNHFDEILARIKECLEGWKLTYLSLAGRQTLVQSILNAILVYAM